MVGAMTVEAGVVSDALKRYFGFDAFRPLQEAIVGDVLAGREHRLDLDLTQTHMVNFQDDVAEVGQGAIADREHERLGRQDEGIIFLRKIWSRELRALEEGSPLTGWERPPGMVPTPRDQAELLTAKGR